MNIFFDKCFLNSKVIDFKDLDNSIKYSEDRLSYTSLKTLNQCPLRFFTETWEDIGLSNTDNSAHGTLGHYLMGEYLAILGTDIDFKEFEDESIMLAALVLTKKETEARKKLSITGCTYFKHSICKLYVTDSFDEEKFVTKISGYLENMDSILYHLPLNKIKNLYIETGIYRVTKTGKVLFGKADLMVEFLDGTYTIIDHKSSFNTLYFESNQLKTYAKLLGKPIKELAVFELSSGSYIKYAEGVQECLEDAKEFISNALVNYKDKTKYCIGEHCGSCSVNCISSITDEEGYILI